MTYKIQRWEWVPTLYEYEIEAESLQEAVEALEAMDSGDLNSEDTAMILSTRSFVRGTDEPESVSEIDESSFWKYKGQNLVDIPEYSTWGDDK